MTPPLVGGHARHISQIWNILPTLEIMLAFMVALACPHRLSELLKFRMCCFQNNPEIDRKIAWLFSKTTNNCLVQPNFNIFWKTWNNLLPFSNGDVFPSVAAGCFNALPGASLLAHRGHALESVRLAANSLSTQKCCFYSYVCRYIWYIMICIDMYVFKKKHDIFLLRTCILLTFRIWI